MVRLYLIRHGQAASKWGDHLDPDLSALGRRQAAHAAQNIAQQIKQPVRIVSSPRVRCRQTAQPLAQLWRATPQIAPEVTEVPSFHKDFSQRTIWLNEIFDQSWDTLRGEPQLISWRQDLLDFLCTCAQDSIIFTHFVAINTAVGRACGDDVLISRYPDYCSLWTFETDGANLRLIEAGREITTKVL